MKDANEEKRMCWSNGVMEYSNTLPLHYSSTPLPPLPRLRLAGLALVGAALLVVTLTGCGPSSGKTGKQSATNAAAPRVLAKTNQALPLRPGVRTNLPPAAARAAAKARPLPPQCERLAGQMPRQP